jgi:hypothetical protein
MNANDVAAWAPYFITLPQAVILEDSMSPTMQNPAFSDLFVFENLLPAFRALYRQHVILFKKEANPFGLAQSDTIRISIPNQEGCGE